MNKVKKLIFKCDLIILENKLLLNGVKEFLKGVKEHV